MEKMRAAGLDEVAVDTFAHYHRLLASGERGTIPESEIEPVADVPDAEALPDGGADAAAALERTALIKLNGGLGTSMGMSGPKSLLEAREGMTFLDVSARQVMALRERSGARLPLVLMNSFATRDASMTALERYPDIAADLPGDFVQGKVPKLRDDDLGPVEWPANPDLEWTPPGHGDLYPSMVSSGMLASLLDAGYEYAFVSNMDNLGAVLDERILGWFAREGLPFAMEVADRTEADRKGGHLARRRDDGGLVLREVAQTPEDDLDSFQDVRRHRFFNTNTLWVNLPMLDAALRERDGVLGLPMIANRKTVDPADPSSPAVVQLETAMGAAIAVFEGAQAIRVPRRRLAPVKTTNDLLALRSDAYVLDDELEIALAPERGDVPPTIDLDPAHFKLVGDFEPRFPAGPPSLRACDRLVVRGDVTFGAGVEVRGDVEVEANEGPVVLEDIVLSG